MDFAAVAFALACVVFDFERAAADDLGLEFLDRSFDIVCAGEIDETVGWIAAGEGIDRHV